MMKSGLVFGAGLTFVVISATGLFAQAVHPVSMGLGGASTTTLFGLDGLHANPSSIFLPRKKERISVTAYNLSGFFWAPALESGGNGRLLDAFSYANSGAGLSTTSDTLQKSLRELFFNGNSSAHLNSGQELLLLAFSYRTKQRTIAFHARRTVRQESRISKHWFQDIPGTASADATYRRNLEQQIRAATEIGITVSGNMSVLSGLIPDFDQLVFGFSPRLILQGASFSGFYSDLSKNGTALQQASMRTTGAFTETERAALASQLPDASAFENQLFDFQGLGAAVDLGLTYAMPGGPDFSLFDTSLPTAMLPGFRFGIAIRDLGFVRRSKNVSTFVSDTLRTTLSDQGRLRATNMFTAKPGSFTGFLLSHPSGRQTLERAASSTGTWNETLPPTLQTGFSMSNMWATMALESTFRVTNLALDEEVFQTSLGLELRPLRWLPIRGGLLFQRELPLYYSAGAGLHNRYVVADVGAMWFKDRSAGNSFSQIGISYRLLVRI